MRLMATALSAIAVAVPHPHHKKPCRTHRCQVRVADRKCSNRRPRWCVLYVILSRRIVGAERSWLLRVPGCESSWNPREVTGISTGLYQFQPPTWAATPYAHRSLWSARWQAFAAAWLYEKDGGGREWVCT